VFVALSEFSDIRNSPPIGYRWIAVMKSPERPHYPREVLASVVVFLVALPLCMGIAIASGAPPAAGLVTGIIGGIIVGSIGGAPLQVSGPAAGLAVIVFDLIQRFGLPMLGAIVLLAGLMQLIAGWRKLGRWFQAVPPSVIYGMLAGIGVLIFASQFHVMIDDAPKGSGIKNLITIPRAMLKAVTPDATLPHEEAAAIGVFTIVLIAIWNGPIAKRVPKLKMVPGALVAVMSATIIANVMKLPIAHVSIPQSLIGSLTFTNVASLKRLLDPSMIGAAAALAIIASAETLLCATAVDRMHDGTRTNYDRELMAQGFGNLLCGIVGGLPMTGVIVRSATNVEAGARTRVSTILHGVWTLALIVAAPFVLRLIPISSLAALLVFTGYKLVKQDVKELRKAGRTEVFIFYATIAGIVCLDLLKGVVLGLVLAVLKIVWIFTHMKIDVVDEGEKTTVRFHGSATFLRLPELNATLERIPVGRDVHVLFDGLDHVDQASLQAIGAWEKQYLSRGGTVAIHWESLEALAKLRHRRNVDGNSLEPDASE
jgi:MFS superfamily sulfate permease-like transporter